MERNPDKSHGGRPASPRPPACASTRSRRPPTWARCSCAVSSTARCTTSSRRTWSTAARSTSRASALSLSRSRRRRAPLLRQDRTVPDQSHGGGAARAPREPSLDRAQPLLRLRGGEGGDRALRQVVSAVLRERTADGGVKRALAEHDPLAYGFKAARPVLATIAQYVHEQASPRACCARRNPRPARSTCDAGCRRGSSMQPNPQSISEHEREDRLRLRHRRRRLRRLRAGKSAGARRRRGELLLEAGGVISIRSSTSRSAWARCTNTTCSTGATTPSRSRT